MNIELTALFPQVTDNQIIDFEKEIGFSLSNEYKDFLKQNNGGYTNKMYVFPIEANNDESDIQCFYGIGGGDDGLLTKFKLLGDCLKERELAIGNDSLGNLIVIDEKGRVSFFSHETETYFMINDGFRDFVDGLSVYEEEESDLDAAIENEDIAYFQKVVKKIGHVDAILDEFDRPVLVPAIMWGKVDLVKFLVASGASLKGAVLNACENANIELIEFLIEIGAGIHEVDEESNNDTPLMKACLGGFTGAVKLLIKKGADIHVQDVHGQTALNKAYLSDNDGLINYLETEVYA